MVEDATWSTVPQGPKHQTLTLRNQDMTDLEAARAEHTTSQAKPNGTVTSTGQTTPPTFPPLKTTITSQSAQEAARSLSNFSNSPENPHNWSNSKRWRITLTVALTGFISTSGSSIAVPGFHEILEEFGVENEKIGVLVTSVYVLGLG